MEQNCKRCHRTGVILIPAGLYSTQASVACSCGAGTDLWDALLKIIGRAEDEARQQRVDRANKQIRAVFEQEKTPERNRDTVRALAQHKGREPAEYEIRVWGSKK
jgi:hypothetical protein